MTQWNQIQSPTTRMNRTYEIVTNALPRTSSKFLNPYEDLSYHIDTEGSEQNMHNIEPSLGNFLLVYCFFINFCGSIKKKSWFKPQLALNYLKKKLD